jgi:UrcA family protein
MSRFYLPAAAGLSAALFFGAAAAAASLDPYGANEQVVETVKVADADLHTAKGAKALALRIHAAAERACGGDTEFLVDETILFSNGFIRCREAAIDRAIKDLDAPLLAEALGRAPPRALASAHR